MTRSCPPVVLVTGATGGLGAAIATALAADGARLVLTARTERAVADLAQELRAAGSEVLPLPADITDPSAAGAVARRAVEEFGRIDVLIDNAGVEGPVGPFWEVGLDDWWEAMRVNVMSTAAAAHAVLPFMVGRGGGRIVSISSRAGQHRWPTLSAYSVSKAAGIKCMENIAHEAREHGVSTFSLHPGIVPIGLTTAALTDDAPATPWHARRRDWLVRQLSEGRGTPVERTVRAVASLAAGTADHLSGRYLTVDDVLGTRESDHRPDPAPA
ncbi:SDR family NAD(P)-dependent oxidoreductase [Streptomyces hainanensis]|uniref:SDR family NAD(P)-dependent oxidoreductase n=1 Tax=Streptomyces hainanensis TaxID=402648 RepID=A0A4R4SYR1_9ACTN|nr:SDR family NAD(P)-dependent oxidoreductase [Streptomyces hainanensis]TDC67672.1 SDR family NAD(P)-dependent oxidoreductase [Streptomyces hainanensis]